MNIKTFEVKVTDYIEKNVILKFYTGLERFALLFALPFKIKEMEKKILCNEESIKLMGFIENDEVNIDKLKTYTIEVVRKCGDLKMSIGSKDITITCDDIEQMFSSL